MEKSTHRVEVVPVVLHKHPEADSLSIVNVYGYQCVVRTEDWQGIDQGAYIVPDSIVDTTKPEFAFLEGHPRVRVRRFRGILSQGLLVKSPAGSKIGDDVSEILGVTRYEPPESFITGGDSVSPPEGIYPVYDVEDWHRYRHLLIEGEEVAVTEKLHGASSRYVFKNDEFYAGSRKEWKRCDANILWWKVAGENPWILKWCINHPGIALYGEVYGSVQSLRYGAKPGQAWFRVFDVFDRGKPWGWNILVNEIPEKHRVPVLYVGPYDPNTIKSLSNGRSTIADNIREGCVVRPTTERSSLEIGRVQLKVVNDDYLAAGK